MSFTNTQLEEIIGTGNGNGPSRTGFRTPQPTTVGTLGAEAGSSKGTTTPKGGKRGVGGGRGEGGRGGYTLKQRKLDDSLKDNNLKRKDRSPEENLDKVKKERTETRKDKEEKDAFAKSGAVKRSPPDSRTAGKSTWDTDEDKEQGQNKEAEGMEQIRKMLKAMNQKMDIEQEERRKMMRKWEKRNDALEEGMNRKMENGFRLIEGKLRVEGEERKKVRIEGREAWKLEERARKENVKALEGKLAKEKAERKEEVKEILEKLEKLEKSEVEQVKKGERQREGGANVVNSGYDKRQMVEMEWRVEEGEKGRKRNNLIISGWQEEKWDRETVEKWIKEKLGEKIGLRKTWIVKGKVRRIGAECRNWEEKGSIMRGKSKLQGSDVFIDHDLTWKD